MCFLGIIFTKYVFRDYFLGIIIVQFLLFSYYFSCNFLGMTFIFFPTGKEHILYNIWAQWGTN